MLDPETPRVLGRQLDRLLSVTRDTLVNSDSCQLSHWKPRRELRENREKCYAVLPARDGDCDVVPRFKHLPLVYRTTDLLLYGGPKTPFAKIDTFVLSSVERRVMLANVTSLSLEIR